jgi:hypothetical protein
MSIINRYLGIVFTGLVFSSCLTTQSVPIDQMEPGKVSLPSTIRKVALISRNFKFSIDTLARYLNDDFRLKKGTKAENLMIDSIGVTKSMENLRKALLESGRFDEVFVYPYNAIKPHKGEKDLPLSPSFIQSVCTESETNAVISLEMLSFFYSRHNGSPGGEFDAEANVKVTAIWSVYTPKNNGAVDRFTHSEVIRWNEGSGINNQKYQLPERKEAVASACGVAAKNYSKRIVPYWAESSRVLIELDYPEFEKAVSFAMKNKWKEAARIWEKYTRSPQKRVAGIADLNYAVAMEMLGDTGKANFWTEESLKLLKNGEKGKIARDYAATLYQRKLKAESLNSLLNVNHP